MMLPQPRPTLTIIPIAILVLFGCSGTTDEPSATDKAIEGLQDKYEDLTQGELEDPMQWASDDIKKIGDWQYRVLEIGKMSGPELEAALNEAGTDRWEVIWMEKTLEGHAIVLKRPSISYLSKIPLSQIGRIVVGDAEPQE
ncbi:MAG: hypothetical protein OER97_05775 [Gammaproteobacteria bacterium]|nr:hypothetical protein [Gammaproteobacteria bacterium]